jgi:hypothetical protein
MCRDPIRDGPKATDPDSRFPAAPPETRPPSIFSFLNFGFQLFQVGCEALSVQIAGSMAVATALDSARFREDFGEFMFGGLFDNWVCGGNGKRATQGKRFVNYSSPACCEFHWLPVSRSAPPHDGPDR